MTVYLFRTCCAMESMLYILSFLKEKKDIFYSWGCSNVVVQEDRLSFSVNGFCFKGKVIVLSNSDIDSFTIRLEDSKGNLYTERTGISLDELVYTVDVLVENSASQIEYEELVLKEYEGEQER